jgi:acyl-coenzyme A synthetase/AMP-(fatty) acid ligase
MTEAGMITSNPLAAPRRGRYRRQSRCTASTSASVDDRGEAAGPGVIGACAVRGPNIFAGYWQNADRTREEFTGKATSRPATSASGAPDAPRMATCASVGARRT